MNYGQGSLLEAAKTKNSDLSSPEFELEMEISVHDTRGALHHQLPWIFIPLNWGEDFRFLFLSTGERLFD
uniref:Uncharacterized protein n=1 Tax=Fagus sylvatica TaxID=28930 RepID=A0A2N9HSH1_FAGSY